MKRTLASLGIALLALLGVVGATTTAAAAPAAPSPQAYAQAQALGFPAGSFVSSAPVAAPALDAAVSAPVLATKASSTRSCWAGNYGHITSSVKQTSSTWQSYQVTVYKPSWYTNWVRGYFDGVGKGYANSTYWVNVPDHNLHTNRVSAANGATCSVRH